LDFYTIKIFKTDIKRKKSRKVNIIKNVQ
jgi:hypothetical protein